MSYVRSFLGYRPPPRYEPDADPFTEVLIEEAADVEGPWSVLETVELDPVDADPAEPASRDLTTDQAQLNPGYYRLTWRDESADTFVGRIEWFPQLPSWAPSVADVGALLHARTKDTGNNELGTFTAQTRPTGQQVELLIAQACGHVRATIGGEPCKPELSDSARRVAALYTAMLVEQSYWPEQTRSDSSSFRSLQSMFDPQLKTLARAVAEECGQGTGEGPDGNEEALPAGGFDDGMQLIGRDYPGTF